MIVRHYWTCMLISFFRTIQNHQLEPVNSVADAQAKIVLQMMFTKTMVIKGVISGINYRSSNGGELNGIIDPIALAALVRNIYETVGMFHLIYRHTNNPDEKLILYNLWVHAGLAYRQKFTEVVTTQENFDKAEEERQMMASLVTEIENTALFQSLSERNKGKILQKIRDKDYLMRFENQEVKFIHWHHLAGTMGIKDGLLDQIYTYFSLYAHPSNVSIFQFADMFSVGEPAFMHIANFNLRNLFILISTFIADYIILFPSVLQTFNQLPILSQLAINFHDKYARGDEYSINDSWKVLG